MANSLFVMERCSDFQSPKKGASDRRTFTFIDATVAEVYENGLESSSYVYDRGLNAGDDWTLRVPLDDIKGAPLCACCDIASVTLDACDMCELCASAAAHGNHREPRERSFRVDDGPRTTSTTSPVSEGLGTEMAPRTTITIGRTAREALERYEAAERALVAVPPPRLMATDAEWQAWDERRKAICAERADAAELLASMVAVAMRMALAAKESGSDTLVAAIDEAFAPLGEF